jgi:dipeptidyl aminopeptidase/acylaminoacyl peptidase
LSGAPDYVAWEQTKARFRNFRIQKIGGVEKHWLELPRASPDGESLLYLRSQDQAPDRRTLLVEKDATPPDGELQIWLRPTAGADPGQRISEEEWVHSARWSPDGSSIVYAANGRDGSSRMVWRSLNGDVRMFGAPKQRNCSPTFSGNGSEIVWSASPIEEDRFSLFRADISEPDSTPISTQILGLHPVGAEDGSGVFYLSLASDRAQLWRSDETSRSFLLLVEDCGPANPIALLNSLASVPQPVGPDGSFCLFDTRRERILTVSPDGSIIQRHREGTFAACWIEAGLIVIATENDLFLTDTTSGMSLTLLNGSWLPIHYDRDGRRLLLLGRSSEARFSVYRLEFESSGD